MKKIELKKTKKRKQENIQGKWGLLGLNGKQGNLSIIKKEMGKIEAYLVFFGKYGKVKSVFGNLLKIGNLTRKI